MTWKTVVLQFYSFPQPLFHVGCTALPVKVKVDVPQGHLQLLVAPSTHRDWLVPAQATDVCGDELTCYFLGTRLNFSALPIPVPLLRFLPPQSPLWLERKSKRKILAASRGDHWDQWVQRRYSCASSSLTLQALVCLQLHSAPFGCEPEQGFGLLPLISSRAVLGWKRQPTHLLCRAE